MGEAGSPVVESAPASEGGPSRSLSALTAQYPSLGLLRRSLKRDRLGHAYLVAGDDPTGLEHAARALAQTLNCVSPPASSAHGIPLDRCGACEPCRKIGLDLFPDVQWVRPESKSRVITVEQMRGLLQTVHLKPAEGRYKVSVITAADRLNVQAANAFLKTLEEPPPRSVLVLLTTEPQRILETITSRCLRLNLGGAGLGPRDPSLRGWVGKFSGLVVGGGGGVLRRYSLLGVLLQELARMRDQIGEQATQRSPLNRYEDAEEDLRERWKGELAAAIEAEYRRYRSDLLAALEWWFRDIWLIASNIRSTELGYPELASETQAVASRVHPNDAASNLGIIAQTQRLLFSNVQEALALEVALLKLSL